LSDHTCFVFFNDAEVPVKWQSTIKCRMSKRRLTTYLSDYFVRNIRPHLTEAEKYITFSVTSTEKSASVMVTMQSGACT